jgi:hypothetical protein
MFPLSELLLIPLSAQAGRAGISDSPFVGADQLRFR